MKNFRHRAGIEQAEENDDEDVQEGEQGWRDTVKNLRNRAGFEQAEENDEDEDVNIVVEEDGGVYSDEDDDVDKEVDVVMGGDSANTLAALRKK